MIGQHIQNYKIIAHLGEGGMGTVYRATDVVLGREVALKMLHATLIQQPQFLDRFKKEARVLAQLLHPNIAVIYNFIEQERNHYMVMEYVKGKNLDALLRQHKVLSYKEVVPVFLQALEGLHHAHKKGVFHRDIKPANLNLTPDGTVKLMDFGIAMMAGEQRLTQVNKVVGTVEYMAPELIQGKEPSVASDIYAVGVTMYELLTGKLPFESETDFNLMQEILKKKPVAAEKLNTSVPKAVSNIVMKALEKKPGNRFADAKSFQQALMNACPELKNADLSSIYHPKPVPATRVLPAETKKGTVPAPTMVMNPGTYTAGKMLSTLRSIRLPSIKLPKEQRRVLAVVLSVLLITVISLFLFTKSDNQQQQPAAKQTAVNNTVPGKENTGNKTTEQRNATPPGRNENTNLVPVTGREPIMPLPKEDDADGDRTKTKESGRQKETPVKEKTTTEKKEPVKKEQVNTPGKEAVEKSDSTLQKETGQKKEEQKKEEVKHVPRRIELVNKVEVNLYLREPINTATAHGGQSLSFSVTSSVRYGGEIIIEKGAIAYGNIKRIGNRKMSILITRVMAVNGQALPFQEVELSGRIDDMLNSRNYSATLKKGSVINF